MIYLDMMPIRTIKAAMTMLRLELNAKLPSELIEHVWEKADDTELVFLSTLALQARNIGIKLVLLIDEVENLLARPDLNELAENLRSLAQQSQIAMITASADPLVRLHGTHGVSSPFYNIFKTEYVGLLSETEWLSLVQNSYARAGQRISLDDLNLIGYLSGGHPYLTQLAGSIVWTQRQKGADNIAIEADFIQQAEPMFNTLWSHQTVPNQATALPQILGLPVIDPLGDQALNAAIHELKLRGVLNAKGEIFSKPFENYVIDQAKRFIEGK